MVYDDSRYRGEPGFRDEPDFRSSGVPEDAPSVSSIYSPGSYPVDDYGPASESTLTIASNRRTTPSASQLDGVFDDPEHGDPGRDRMGVHVLWELVLLLGAGALAFLLRDADPAALKGTALKDLFLFAVEVGLLAVCVGLSLRANSVNLAVGPIAYAAALFFADRSDKGLLVTAGFTLLIALGAGAVIAVLVVGFHVPSWAASFGAALALLVWIDQHRAEKVVAGAYDPHKHALYWFVGLAVLSMAGGLLGIIKPIRRGVGRFRPVADPARRRGGVGGALSAVALMGSSVLAAGAGIVLALDQRDVTPTENGLALTGLALGAALLGGTSAFGRRGGILGTLLAVILIVLLVRYSTAENWNVSLLAVAAFSIGGGLVVTRLVETFGRPRPVIEEPEEPLDIIENTGGWTTGSRTGGWTSQLPARTTDEGWGAEERWSAR
jgi:ribose/xylose/arabinose/galactoside ABC-type transport system permease subunit